MVILCCPKKSKLPSPSKIPLETLRVIITLGMGLFNHQRNKTSTLVELTQRGCSRWSPPSKVSYIKKAPATMASTIWSSLERSDVICFNWRSLQVTSLLLPSASHFKWRHLSKIFKNFFCSKWCKIAQNTKIKQKNFSEILRCDVISSDIDITIC